MQNHCPVSPPLSNASDHKSSFNEGPHNSNESPFLHAQQTPESVSSAFGDSPSGQQQTLPYRTLEMNIEMDNATLSRAMEPYPAPNGYASAPQTAYPHIAPGSHPQFFGASHPIPTKIEPSNPISTLEGLADSDALMIARSMQGIPPTSQRCSNRPRVERTQRVRKPAPKKKPERSEKPKIKVLNSTVPLSQLTEHLSNLDAIETFVTRSVETRLAEIKKRKDGKIPRPMNSFMLYRRAFTERAKEWCAQNNHQIVSRATAESWRIETPSIRAFFERNALIERENHKRAHPEYKFTPNKNAGASKKGKKPCDDGDDDDYDRDMDDNDDFDYALSPDTSQSVMTPLGSTCDSGFNSRTPTPLEQDFSYGNRTVTPPTQGSNEPFRLSDTNASSWVNINPGRPMPGMLSPSEQSHHYYQSSIHPSSMGPNIEDVTYRRMHVPGVEPYDASSGLAAIPGNAQPELLQPQPQQPPHVGTSSSMESTQVDPQLLHAHGLPIDDQFGSQQLDIWQPFQENENQHYTHTTSSETMRTQDSSDQYLPPTGYPQHPSVLAPGLDGRDVWSDGQVGAGPTAGFEEWLNGQSAY